MEEVMKILFLGGDKRYKLMMEILKKEHKIHQIGFISSDNEIYQESPDSLVLSDFDVVLFPINGINDNLEVKAETGLVKLSKDTFKHIDKKTKFFTGLKTTKLLDIIPKEQIISFLDNKEVEKVNNSLTIDRSY